MPAKKAAGPTYLDLIKAAIISLKQRGGSSLQAIKKFVAAKKGAGYVNGVFLRALRSAVAKGALIQNKGSYKLGAAPKKAPAKKKAAPKVRRFPCAANWQSALAPPRSKLTSGALRRFGVCTFLPQKKAAPKKKKAATKKKKAPKVCAHCAQWYGACTTPVRAATAPAVSC